MIQEALLVIDMQNGLTDTHDYPKVLTRINQRIAAYHAHTLPVIFMQHTDEELPYGSDAWQLDDKLARQPQDRVMLKYHSDSFFETGLTTHLQHLGVNELEACGLQTEYCVDTAIRVGHDRGFQMAIGRGLSTTYDSAILTAEQIRAHHESIWDGSFATLLTID